MSEEKVMNRWLVVVGAILIQLCLGAIYAWSVFTPALSAVPGDLPDIYGAEQLGIDAAAYEQLTADVEKLNEDIKALSPELDKLKKGLKKGEVEFPAGLKAELDGKITALQGEIATAEQEVTDLQAQLEATPEEEDGDSAAPEGLSDEKKAELEGRIATLKGEIEAKGQEVADLEKERDADPVTAAEARKTELEGQVAALNTKKDDAVAAVVPGDKLDALTYGEGRKGFKKIQSQSIFSAGLALFAIIMVLAGRLMPRVGPRKLAVAGGLVLGSGYVLAGLFGTSFWPLFIFLGIIGGSGIGLAYVVPIAVGMRWFPDKKGMITGLAVAGFGFGATGWVKFAGAWGHMIENMGLNTTFLIYGIVFAVAVCIGGMWMVFPPENWKPEGWEPPAPKAAGAAAAGTVNFESGEMLRKPQFWMIFLTFLFGASAGLMSIGLMKAFPKEALVDGGMGIKEALAVAGTAMAVFFSLANGLGRIGWGMISDKLGRKLSIIIMTVTQGILLLAFPVMAGTKGLLYLAATLIGFNFGGNFALFPTITADTFGTKNVGKNYGWVFLAYGVGGILGPTVIGGKLGDMGNFPLAFTITGVCCLVAAGIIAMVKPATK